MVISYAFKPAQPKDEKAIKNFLKKCGLPFEDISPGFLEHFFPCIF